MGYDDPFVRHLEGLGTTAVTISTSLLVLAVTVAFATLGSLIAAALFHRKP